MDPRFHPSNFFRPKEALMNSRLLSIPLALTLVACGGNNNAGTGTSTLRVQADVDATPSSTDLQVEVRDSAGNRISGATVIISNPTWGPVTLPEANPPSGQYVGSKIGFPAGDFTLSVAATLPSGIPANVQNVVVGGPGVHAINAPAQNAIVPKNVPLQLSWTTPSLAMGATIRTKDYGPAAATDSGTFTIPGPGNPPNNNQSLTIARYNEIDMAGGVSGSRLRVTVESVVSPYFVQ